MQIKFPFDSSKPVVGEASVEINKSINDVFSYVGENFFNNYPNWAVEVIKFQPLDGDKVFIGAKAKQVRKESGTEIESIFEITDYKPTIRLCFQGVNTNYKHSYLLETGENNQPTKLTFRFELSELEIFMRPFEKMIRIAIEDGAENTVENIKNLIEVETIH
ncbi:MAG: SRPBCC family protein [Methylococcaceae bacterium]|jgi:hypothetical protein|nr:SRPBCC family protein [Methylococcaceae bacterium]MDZ4155791.1 SRPBCC family protein [Methylococcales bacterium]MDP2391860.1 SRPBCC family protein [Methylococcaceae bacterium]MDP3018901.1 SRPBCC family protein [Methylococcaceae bacterium]MDP3391462.1 SRPBCC family protein [Methylococcaceae bacterium]